MGLRASDQIKSVMAFPGGLYGSVTTGGIGGTTEYVNGSAAPGTTATMGDTGPLGAPIDTLGFTRALIKISEQGATQGSFTITAKTGTNDWYSHSGTTDLPGFSEVVGTTGNAPYQRSIDVDLRNCQRYLWIRALQTAASASRFSIEVVLTNPDKVPVTQNKTDTVPDPA